jgi:hypothetical protein
MEREKDDLYRRYKKDVSAYKKGYYDYELWLENKLIEAESELKKLRVTDVSVCSCGSDKYYSEQYKDVTKYYCSSCHEKIESKN